MKKGKSTHKITDKICNIIALLIVNDLNMLCVYVCVCVSAQELARQEEKVLLVEAGQHRTQEHLAERVAEVVRAEQAQRKLQAELRTLKERLHTTEHELQGYRYSTGLWAP